MTRLILALAASALFAVAAATHPAENTSCESGTTYTITIQHTYTSTAIVPVESTPQAVVAVMPSSSKKKEHHEHKSSSAATPSVPAPASSVPASIPTPASTSSQPVASPPVIPSSAPVDVADKPSSKGPAFQAFSSVFAAASSKAMTTTHIEVPGNTTLFAQTTTITVVTTVHSSGLPQPVLNATNALWTNTASDQFPVISPTSSGADSSQAGTSAVATVTDQASGAASSDSQAYIGANTLQIDAGQTGILFDQGTNTVTAPSSSPSVETYTGRGVKTMKVGGFGSMFGMMMALLMTFMFGGVRSMMVALLLTSMFWSLLVFP